MSDNSSEQEPSIEEILASIRQIISDDDEQKPQKSLENPVQHGNNDVLELTEDDLADLDVSEDEMDIEMRDEEEFLEEPEEAPYVPPSRSVPSDILSSVTQKAALGSIAKLTKKMPINRPRSFEGITLEDIVREMLHPMLREWMDDNLPPMVERIVQRELEKLARRAIED